MAVEIGIRIKSQNMTGQDFDNLIGDLKKTERQVVDTERETRKFGQTLSANRTQLRNVALDAAAVTTGLGLVGESFVESAIRMEGYRNGLIALEGSAEDADTRLNSLREIIQLPGVSYEGATQAAVRLKTIGFEAELANRSITEFGNALALVGSAEDVNLNQTEDIARSSLESVGKLLEVFNQLRNGTRLSIDELREFDRVVARSLFAAREQGNDSVVSILEGTAQQVRDLYKEFEGGRRRIQRGVVEPTRNFNLELVNLNANLTDAEDAFRNVSNISELEGVTQSYLSALDAVNRVSREQIEAQIAVEGAALARLANQERAESDHAKKIGELTIQLRQMEIDSERRRTQITRDEVSKRTELSERAAQQRIDIATREAAEQSRVVDSVKAQVDNFLSLTDAVGGGIQRLETSIYVFSGIFRREFTRSLQFGSEVLNGFQNSLRETRLSALEEAGRGSDVLSRLEDGQAERDRRTAELFAAGAASFREQDRNDSASALDFVSSIRREQAFDRGRLIEGAGDLISTVPLDVVDAATDIVQVRRDANAELIILEKEAAAEIQIIQESVTLSAENKAKAIERVERQSALKRIRIENEVSQQQRASFQSVVTNFVSGIGRMIAAEAQLALARRATSAISGLFGGGAGAGLLSGVALPLVGGLALAYGASRLIAPSSPSADVYQSSQVLGSTSQTPGLTRASQETDSPVLEANINVNVEASGTRLGQANDRVRVKTERWGG